MKLLPKLLAATSIFAATAAIAGPPVTVTFKGSSQKTEKIVRSACAEAGIQHYKIGMDTPRFLATSLGRTPLGSREFRCTELTPKNPSSFMAL